MLALSKIATFDDLSHPDLNPYVRALLRVEDELKEKGVCPELPTPMRRWEYAQALRALDPESLTPEFSILEVGGSNSLFMPTAMRMWPDVDFTSIEHESWAHPGNLDYQKRQAPQGVLHQVTTAPEGQWDAVVCISVIENLDWPERGEVVERLNSTALSEKTKRESLAEAGHSFMTMFVEDELAPKVRKGGVLFLTSDLGDRLIDDYHWHWMRPPGIWTPECWQVLMQQLCAREQGRPQFEPIEKFDFSWPGPAYLGYSFASMALRRIR